MCGLAGLWSRRAPIDAAALESAGDALAHRGPDGRGLHRSGDFGLVAARLAIIDRGGSAQPIRSADGQWVLAANAEVYNHRELKAPLVASGARFTTAGDAEVLLHLVAAEGPEGLARVRGPFALALWNERERTLTLARDRWGERPLFLSARAGGLAFASELRALQRLLWPHVLPPDRTALAAFLACGLLPAGRSGLEDAAPVEPGTAVTFDAAGHDRLHRYHRPPRLCGPSSPTPPAEALDAALTTALDRALVADLPPWVAFSGGLDSSAIAAHCLERGLEVEAFTLHDAQTADPNLERAQAVARALGLRHTAIPFAWPTVPQVQALLRERVDGPSPKPIVLHNDALHRALGGRGRVLLGGHAADEVLGGYSRYRELLTGGPSSPARLEELPFGPGFARWRRLREVASGLSSDLLAPPLRAEVTRELSAELLAAARQTESLHPVDQAQAIDLLVLTRWDNLALPDESGLSHSLEVRTPFFDADLVATSFALPAAVRLEQGETKAVLRRRLERRVGRELLALPKLGFDSSFDYPAWLAAHRAELHRAVAESGLAGLELGAPSALAAPSSRGLLWRSFALAAWLEGPAVRPPPRKER